MDLTHKETVINIIASGSGLVAVKAFRKAGARIFPADLQQPTLEEAGK